MVSTSEFKTGMIIKYENGLWEILEYQLVKMHDRVIKSRDGLDLVCYLSLPPGSDPDNDGIPNHPLPME